ncbi:MAG: phage major capsid protein [Acidobacteria bacterium]|nr:phage major capsid protein [Acidobacteriota bacterium]
MNLVEQRAALQTQIDGLLSKPSMTATERKQCDALLSKVADIRAQEARQARLDAALQETRGEREADSPEYRAAKHESEFGRYALGQGPDAALVTLRVDGKQVRTYTPMSIPGVPMPEGFLSAYREALKSFVGIREAGAAIITTQNGDNLKNPFSDDTANVGERLNENDLASLANPTLNKTEFIAYNYGSKGVQYSVPLLRDAGIDVTEYLRNIFAKRIGRITNTEFTNGAVGGPAGVIPSITNVQTSASATAVTVAEIVGLQNLDEGYLNGSVYMFSPGVERTLRAMVNADGLPIFPEMRSGRVLAGYPYVLNVDMPTSLTASAKTVVFGNFNRGVAIREVVPTLLVSKERYAEFRLMYSVLFHRQDCQVTDAKALNVLQQHS